MEPKRYKYITIAVIAKMPKTFIWGIYNNSSEYKIGEIKWHGPWRQYCVFISSETVFSKGCLSDISDFLTSIKDVKEE